MAQWEAPMRQTALPSRHQYRLQIAERRGKILGELSIAGSILTTIAQMTDTEMVMNLLRQVPLFANLGKSLPCLSARDWTGMR